MKTTALLALMAATMAPLASARNCKTGLNYCGKLLLGIGNYNAQILQALKDQGQPTDPKHVDDALFHCDGGANVNIHFLSFCGEGRCILEPDNQDDHCEGSRVQDVFKA